MKVLVGALTPDDGECIAFGSKVEFSHPSQAFNAGIGIVYQEFSLLPDRNVVENIFLGRELRKCGLLNTRDMARRCRGVLDVLALDLPLTTLARDMSVAEQQMIEIARALVFDARVLILDEPTASLAEDDANVLYQLIRRLRDRGIGIIYVSHRMSELLDLSDRVVVLKDGELVADRPTQEWTADSIVEAMIGGKIEGYYPPKQTSEATGTPMLDIRGAYGAGLKDVNLTVRSGEIAGIYGLKGSGRSELAYALWGEPGFTSGTVRIGDEPVSCNSALTMMRHKVGFVPESRKTEGLALMLDPAENALLAIRAKQPLVRRVQSSDYGPLEDLFQKVDLRSLDITQPVEKLSGGNQQKVVLAKWLLTEPRLLILAEPTRGVDVKAKKAIYGILRKLAQAGHAILVLSSDLPEIVGLCDRTFVMRDQTVVQEFPSNATEAEILVEAGGVIAKKPEVAA